MKTLIVSESQKPDPITFLLHIVLKKTMSNTSSLGTQLARGNYAL